MTKVWSALFVLTLGCLTPASLFAEKEERVMVIKGHSQIIEFGQPITRIAITEPEIADAMVTSPTQILINAKTLGTTSLVVWDEANQYKSYKVIVHSQATDYQVMLRVHFAEVTKSALSEFGINILGRHKDTIAGGSFGGKINTPSAPLTLDDNVDFFLALPSKNISAIMKAMEEQNLLTILAKPNLTTIDGIEASFLAGGEFPIPIIQGVPGAQAVTIHFKEFGIKLKFKPTVLDAGLVNIKVSTEVSNLDFENGVTLNGFQIPSLRTRKSETTVQLHDGEHFIIGGLISNDIVKSISRVPVLGHIPLLGKLFSSTRFQNNESELIIMITPTIIHTMRDNTIPQLRR